ncbi:hypothetical protein [Cognatishimia sp.]|uniref:hypothetical protein n=1 Tax=Cognatishimia sp. TaxID=2211648 RepID=UPI003510FF55|nr:hypothetical protein [Cognatishimia sp.]
MALIDERFMDDEDRYDCPTIKIAIETQEGPEFSPDDLYLHWVEEHVCTLVVSLIRLEPFEEQRIPFAYPLGDL